jgi:hypothetical protein
MVLETTFDGNHLQSKLNRLRRHQKVGPPRVPHFSRSLREVGLFAGTFLALSQRPAEFCSRQRMNIGASLGLS